MKKVLLGLMAATAIASSAGAADYSPTDHLIHTDKDGSKYIEKCVVNMGLLGCWKYEKHAVE